MMQKICPKCGSPNSNTSDWCVNCSSNLQGAKIIYKEGVEDKSDDHLNFEPEKGRPPIVVIILGLILVLTGFLSFFVFGLFILTAIASESLDFLSSAILALAGMLYFLLAGICFILVYGLRKGKTWAWKLAIIWLIIAIILEVSPMTGGFSLLSTGLVIICFVLFLLPGTKMYFKSYTKQKSNFGKIIGVFLILSIIVFASLFFAFQSEIQPTEKKPIVSGTFTNNYIGLYLKDVGKNYNDETGYTNLSFKIKQSMPNPGISSVDYDFDSWKKTEFIYFVLDEHNWICTKNNSNFNRSIDYFPERIDIYFNDEDIVASLTVNVNKN